MISLPCSGCPHAAPVKVRRGHLRLGESDGPRTWRRIFVASIGVPIECRRAFSCCQRTASALPVCSRSKEAPRSPILSVSLWGPCPASRPHGLAEALQPHSWTAQAPGAAFHSVTQSQRCGGVSGVDGQNQGPHAAPPPAPPPHRRRPAHRHLPARLAASPASSIHGARCRGG